MSQDIVDQFAADKVYANSFRDLIVYRKSVVLARDLFRLSLTFPKDEKFGLNDQMRRSSRSIGAQIAEAWGKRVYERSFVAKLVDADAEQMETQHWILVATSCGYITRDLQKHLRERCDELGRMLGSMILNAGSFCRPDLLLAKESHAVYSAGSMDDLDWLFEEAEEPAQSE